MAYPSFLHCLSDLPWLNPTHPLWQDSGICPLFLLWPGGVSQDLHCWLHLRQIPDRLLSPWILTPEQFLSMSSPPSTKIQCSQFNKYFKRSSPLTYFLPLLIGLLWLSKFLLFISRSPSGCLSSAHKHFSATFYCHFPPPVIDFQAGRVAVKVSAVSSHCCGPHSSESWGPLQDEGWLGHTPLSCPHHPKMTFLSLPGLLFHGHTATSYAIIP